MGCCESRHKNIKKNMEKTSIITKKNENKKINIQNPNIENPIKQTEQKVIARNIDYNQLKTIKTIKHSHDSKVYLLYSYAGESGIAIGEIDELERL